MKTSATSLIAIMNLAVAAAKEVRHLRKLQPMSMEFSSTKEYVPGGMNVISSEDGKSAETIQQQTSTKPDVGDLISNETNVEESKRRLMMTLSMSWQCMVPFGMGHPRNSSARSLKRLHPCLLSKESSLTFLDIWVALLHPLLVNQVMILAVLE